ncbi:MAG: class I SAM-dependent methyltransferase [Patescibacteria group bacterium]
MIRVILMTLYVRNNSAKQWIFEDLHRWMNGRDVRILDLACGDARNWSLFLQENAHASLLGVDTNAAEIERAKTAFHEQSRAEFRSADAQHPIEENTFHAITAMSAIEHVVNRTAFLNTVWRALMPGGRAYLNYDEGHFRSRDPRERMMIPISQLLSWFGIEAPYMKRVDDAAFRRAAEAMGFTVADFRLHNIAPLKGLLKGANDEAIAAWYAFEESMGANLPQNRLRGFAYSATLVLEKPL